MTSKRIRIGIDTGGTFTDFVIVHDAQAQHFKLPSTPHDPAKAVLEGLARIRAMWPGAPFDIVHGSTIATNALLQRRGARTALVTTAGFEDVLEIGRQARPRLYDLNVDRPPPLVPAGLRFGARERIGPRGDVLIELQPAEIERLVAAVRKARVESLAICLLFSFVNPRHEQLIEKAMEALGLPISSSYRILPEYREYERTSTVVINAYVMPLAGRYLQRLLDGVRQLDAISQLDATARARRAERKGREGGVRLRVMQSSGGSMSAEAAAREPVRIVLSGPAGGVVGALAVARKSGFDRIITFDMGGTSTDVSLCVGRVQTTNEAQVADLPVAIPVIDIHTVGAGGGSIARLDAGGALRVGPESAGADPGPVCYGKGEAVTVTDANLILGRFGGRALLGGEMLLDDQRAASYMDAFAQAMSQATGRKISREQAALGIVNVANANMEGALRKISIERGYDPRDFTLVCFGGAGGLHVCALAQALRIRRIIVPLSPGTLSALGALLADVQKDYSQTVMLPGEQASQMQLERVFRRLESVGRKELASEGFHPDQVRVERACAVRYCGQSFELEIPWSHRWQRDFHQAHQIRYGYADPSRPTEIVSARIRCIGRVQKPRLKSYQADARQRPRPRYELVVVKDHAEPVAVYSRDDLPVGCRLKGPVIITEYSSTTFIPPEFALEVDRFKNMLIEQRLRFSS
ncbi:MAG: hydantoinase/oxoprolinase family protein [Acidobacteriota bacterium]|nr:hydantoinase/oxoprolinase family protein [Blastocatellia bacterium]MDW8237973.1 hydantoinase/oxoprolinase family protein [Acidobacteriota bacterium]